MKYFVWTLLGYLCGSLMFSSLVSNYLCNIDIGTISDDKNPGAGNVFKYVGTGWGILCLVLDIGKGFLPVWMAARMAGVESILFALVIAAPVAGHAFPVFHKWKGGKAIAVTFGVLLGISSYSDAVWLLACLLILFTGVLVVRPHHVRVIQVLSMGPKRLVLTLAIRTLQLTSFSYVLLRLIRFCFFLPAAPDYLLQG